MLNRPNSKSSEAENAPQEGLNRFDGRLAFNCGWAMHERVVADVPVCGSNLCGPLVARLQSPVDSVSKLKMHL